MTVHFTDGISLRFDTYEGYQPDGRWWYCDHAEPSIWFSQLWLNQAREAKRQANMRRRLAIERGDTDDNEPEWSFYGPWHIEDDTVKLRAANGVWVWVLTDNHRHQVNVRGAEAAVWIEGVWPD